MNNILYHSTEHTLFSCPKAFIQFVICWRKYGFEIYKIYMKFEILKTVNMKITVLWDVTLRTLIEMYWRFGGTIVNFHNDTQRHSAGQWSF